MRSFFLLLLVVALLFSPAVLSESEDAVSVLLLGTDNLGRVVTGEEEDSRADAIFILIIQPETGGIRLMSVERDYLVTLPNGLGKNKIGTATFFGGPQMCLEAVNGLFHIDIRDYVQINLTNLVQAIDLIGGIDIEIYEEEVVPTNMFIGSIPPFDLPYIKSGVNHLDGNQVWAFMGNRESSGNSIQANKQRNTRQMRAITAGYEKLQKLGSSEVIEIVDQILPMIKTNLTLYDVLSIFNIAMESDLENLSYLYSPNTAFSVKNVDMHRVVILEDEEAERQVIQEFLYK